MIVVVPFLLMQMAMDHHHGHLLRVGVILQLQPVVLRFVGRETDPDRRTQSPAHETSDGDPAAARDKHHGMLLNVVTLCQGHPCESYCWPKTTKEKAESRAVPVAVWIWTVKVVALVAS